MLTLPDCSNESTPIEPVLEFCRSNVVIPIINRSLEQGRMH